MDTKLTPGQKLWFVPEDKRWRKEGEVTIAKVGRKWAELTEIAGRVNLETLRTDPSWGVHGTCYLSQEDAERQQVTEQAWSAFYRKLSPWKAPRGITADRITEAARLLGVG